MALVVITGIGLPNEAKGGYRAIINFGVVEGELEAVYATVEVLLVPGNALATTKDDIADAVEAATLDLGYSLGTYGDPIPTGRLILFPDYTWAGL